MILLTHLKINFFSNALGMDTIVNVLLPRDFTNQDPVEDGVQKYKTLYLLHGYFGNQEDWMRYTTIEHYANKYRLAVVMPSAYNSYYCNMVHGFNYYDYISTELPNYLEELLPLAKQKENRFVAGLSMGGYGALKLGLTETNRFHAAISLSGALDIHFIHTRPSDELRTKQIHAIFGDEIENKNDLFYLADHLKQSSPKLYIACGTDDFLYDSNIKFIDHLKELRIPHTFIQNKGDHTWEYWDHNIELALDWLFETI